MDDFAAELQRGMEQLMRGMEEGEGNVDDLTAKLQEALEKSYTDPSDARPSRPTSSMDGKAPKGSFQDAVKATMESVTAPERDTNPVLASRLKY